MRRLLLSSFVAITAVVATGYGAFEYWVNLKANTLPKSVTEGKLAEIAAADVEQITSLAAWLNQSPLPWHQQRADRFQDLAEVAEAAENTFSRAKVSQLQVGQLLTLQQELEDYIQRYPEQADAMELQEELPAVRSLVTFYPIIKTSAGERPVKSALQTSRRGATLAALVIRKPTEATLAAVPTVPTVSWSKAENDVLFDYAQALQAAERERIGNDDKLKIGRQVCAWLDSGQGYWGVRSLFDSSYRGTVQGNYYHNRDVYIQFGATRLCPQHMANLVRPPEPTDVQIAKTPVSNPTASTKNWNPAPARTTPHWTAEAPAPQIGNAPPYVEVLPIGPGGMVPPPGFAGGIR